LNTPRFGENGEEGFFQTEAAGEATWGEGSEGVSECLLGAFWATWDGLFEAGKGEKVGFCAVDSGQRAWEQTPGGDGHRVFL